MSLTKKKNLQNTILESLSSARFAAYLFILLALIIIVGTVVPQEAQVGKQALIEKYASNYSIMNSLGLTDIFHSWWYLLLMVLLAVNLSLVSFRRVFPRAKKALIWPQMIPQKVQTASLLNGADNLKGKEFFHHLEIKDWENFLAKLKKNGWSLRVERSTKSFVARKGAYHRLGPSITHVGILTILFGAFLSLIFGFNGVIKGVPGDRFIISNREDSKRSYILVTTSKIFHSPLWLGKSPEVEVEIGKTSREDHKNGSPKQWRTELIFFNNDGKLLKKQESSVNEPVSFSGIDFFQADWKRVLRIKFNSKDFEIELNKIQNSLEVAYIPASEELGLLFLLETKKPNELNVFSVKGNSSPKVFSDPKSLIASGALRFLGKARIKEEIGIGPMKIKFLGAFSQSGLQYKFSPGDQIMIAGMLILILGVLIAFGSKRVLWGFLDQDSTKFVVLGNADRLRDSFSLEFKQLMSV